MCRDGFFGVTCEESKINHPFFFLYHYHYLFSCAEFKISHFPITIIIIYSRVLNLRFLIFPSQTFNKFCRDYGLIKMVVTLVNCYFRAGYSGTSFLATFDTDSVTPGDPIVFNYIVHNSGGHYNSTTGIYHCTNRWHLWNHLPYSSWEWCECWGLASGWWAKGLWNIPNILLQNYYFYGLDGNTAFHHTIENKNAFQWGAYRPHVRGVSWQKPPQT